MNTTSETSVAYEIPKCIQDFFGPEFNESDLADSVRFGRQRVINYGEIIGIDQKLLAEVEGMTQFIAMPSSSRETRNRLSVEVVPGRIDKDDQRLKVSPSLPLMKQVRKGLEISYAEEMFFEGERDYKLVRMETAAFLNRMGVALRFIDLMRDKLDNGDIFRAEHADIGRYSFASGVALQALFINGYGKVFSVDAGERVKAMKQSMPSSMKRSSELLRHDAINDPVTFGLVRPMTDEELLETVQTASEMARKQERSARRKKVGLIAVA